MTTCIWSAVNPKTGLGSLTPGVKNDCKQDKSMQTAEASPSEAAAMTWLSSFLFSRISFWKNMVLICSIFSYFFQIICMSSSETLWPWTPQNVKDLSDLKFSSLFSPLNIPLKYEWWCSWKVGSNEYYPVILSMSSSCSLNFGFTSIQESKCRIWSKTLLS